MAYLELDGIGKRFRSEQVLKDLSLGLERGETVAVFGPSGSGKTVLLRLIAGVLDADAGRITIDGRDVTALPPERRGVGMAFQTFALYPHLSAYDNIKSPLAAQRLGGDDIKRRVGAVAELLRIGHVLGHLPAQLSNGQKQRTSLARALVGAPGVLLLDDPLRNVDAKLRYEMRVELPRVLREFDTTVLYVTQDYKEAMALGDRIGVLGGGRFRQLGTPSEIYLTPATLDVARLFGDPPINVLDVIETGRGPALALDRGTGAAPPLPDGLAAAASGRRCRLGVRPEDVTLHRRPADGAFALELETVTPLNLRQVMLLRADDGTELLASTTEQDVVPADGERVWATLDWTRARLFDADSGVALEAV